MGTQAEYIYNKPSHIENCKRWYQPDFPWLSSMEEWWPLHKDLKWRDDDVIVCTFPRSGTHLMGNMVKMIITQDIRKTLEYPFENTGISFMSFKDDQDGRRVLSSHIIPFDYGDEAILGGNRKFIHVIRDPKPACVSLYRFMKTIPTMVIDPGSFDRFALNYVKEIPSAVDHDWVTHTRAFEEYIDRHPTAPIMHIYFNDIINDMEGMVKKLADFLDVKLSMDKIEEIVEGCGFENMRTGAVSDIVKDFSKDGSKLTCYGTGQSDDWKNFFTVALMEKFDSEVSRRMHGSNIQITK